MKAVRDSSLRYLIKEYADKRGLDESDLCKRVGVSMGTWYSRVKDPDTFKLGELRIIARVLNLPVDRLISATRLGT